MTGALANQLETSRGTVREALRTLVDGGLIDIVPRRGVFVSQLSVRATWEITSLRALLEPYASRLALENAGSDPGIVAEVRALEGRGLRQGRTASRALGYRQILDLLADEIDEPSARRQTVFGTRRFARRQAGWFRKDPRIHWLPATGPELTAHALRLLKDVPH